jgi:hypothetical protein
MLQGNLARSLDTGRSKTCPLTLCNSASFQNPASQSAVQKDKHPREVLLIIVALTKVKRGQRLTQEKIIK